VFWTKKTRVNYNGYTRKHPGDNWLPESFTVNKPPQTTVGSVALPGGYTVTSKPLTSEEMVLPQGKRFAVLLDTSYSMTPHVKVLQSTFDWLQKTLASDNHIDVYLSDPIPERARRFDNLSDLDSKKLFFFGTTQFKDILRQFDQLRGNTVYDAILLVTDEGSYELADDDPALPIMPAPLWMVHVSGLPKAYDDTTLQAIQQSGGGVAASAEEVVKRLATTAALGENIVSVTDGYAWFLDGPQKPVITADLDTPSAVDGLTALAARQLILGLSRRLDMSALENLDFIHALAKSYQIVSPYSSMIVLVNERQKEELAEAEVQADRFEREVETGHEVLQEPANPLNVPGSEMTIPEPDTMLLVGVVVIILGWLAIRRRRDTKRETHIITR
jgi:putative PEP-CTERM system integral membrane protein